MGIKSSKPSTRAIRPSAHPPVFAGVDAGGSHSEVVLIDAGGTELSRVRGGPAALRPDNSAKVALTIAGILRKARSACGNPAIKRIVVAAAGAGRRTEQATLKKALAKAGVREPVRVIGDGEAGLESAFPGAPGVVLLSGTGSIAYARDRSGKIHRVGGLGWQLGDEGSGYAIGRAALGAVGRAIEGRGPNTPLCQMILAATSSADLSGLIRWGQTATREKVAALAPLVFEAVEDPVSRGILRNAAVELVMHVAALLSRVAPDVPDGIVLGGGLLGLHSPLRLNLLTELSKVALGIPTLDRTIDPALGAARLATRL